MMESSLPEIFVAATIAAGARRTACADHPEADQIAHGRAADHYIWTNTTKTGRWVLALAVHGATNRFPNA